MKKKVYIIGVSVSVSHQKQRKKPQKLWRMWKNTDRESVSLLFTLHSLLLAILSQFLRLKQIYIELKGRKVFIPYFAGPFWLNYFCWLVKLTLPWPIIGFSLFNTLRLTCYWHVSMFGWFFFGESDVLVGLWKQEVSYS